MISTSFKRLGLCAVASGLTCTPTLHAETAAGSFAIDKPLSKAGFLIDKYQDQLRDKSHGGDSWLSRLCTYSTRETRIGCPKSLPAPSSFTGSDQLTTGAPNLRLRIVLTSMQNTVVAGSGIDSPAFDEALITWKIESLDANQSIPALDAEPYALFAPLPGTTIEAASDHANGLYQGLITNGCVGTPATYALTLKSETVRVNGDKLGSYAGADAVVGWGWNGLDYTTRASDSDGNSSDFRIRGVAYADCVFDDNLNQNAVIKQKTKLVATDLAAAKNSDRYISADDVERARGRYALNVRGVGEYRILSISSKESGKRCLVDRQALVNELRTLGLVPGPQGTEREITMKGTPGENGVTICNGSGEGCKILMPVWDPDDPVLPK